MDPEVPQALADPDRLNGWKEIAGFLGKGVRTVQRWERELGLPVHRLGREGGEIVFAFRLVVTRRPDGTPSLWVVFTHGMEFPSLLMEIDPRGAITSEYWSNGFIDSVTEMTWDGRPAVIVGATNNETHGASLAVFDREHVTGSAPAGNPAYRCVDCPPGAPLEFLLFPRRCIARAGEGQPTVDSVWMDAGGRVHVSVVELDPLRRSNFPNVWYWFGPGLRPERAELSGELLSAHREMEQAGLLDHAFGPADEADLFPVRRWNGSTFVDLPSAPVTR